MNLRVFVLASAFCALALAGGGNSDNTCDGGSTADKKMFFLGNSFTFLGDTYKPGTCPQDVGYFTPCGFVNLEWLSASNPILPPMVEQIASIRQCHSGNSQPTANHRLQGGQSLANWRLEPSAMQQVTDPTNKFVILQDYSTAPLDEPGFVGGSAPPTDETGQGGGPVVSSRQGYIDNVKGILDSICTAASAANTEPARVVLYQTWARGPANIFYSANYPGYQGGNYPNGCPASADGFLVSRHDYHNQLAESAKQARNQANGSGRPSSCPSSGDLVSIAPAGDAWDKLYNLRCDNNDCGGGTFSCTKTNGQCTKFGCCNVSPSVLYEGAFDAVAEYHAGSKGMILNSMVIFGHIYGTRVNDPALKTAFTVNGVLNEKLSEEEFTCFANLADDANGYNI